MSATRPLTVFAPAKINLYLHITGRQDNGYHTLDSMVVFADIGDRVMIEPAATFSFQVNRLYAGAFTASDRDDSEQSTNLAVRAAYALAKLVNRKLKFRITLTKNLPLASGIGGGSSDAAAVIWGLMKAWDIQPAASPWLPELMLGLGADIPACLNCLPVQMQGVGEILRPLHNLPEMPIILINPGKHCKTADIFQRFTGPMLAPQIIPGDLQGMDDFLSFLRLQSNSLSEAAIKAVPEIENCLSVLGQQKGCALARMSGSGATVFGLFESMEDAQDAAEDITCNHPGWWVRAGTISGPQRY